MAEEDDELNFGGHRMEKIRENRIYVTHDAREDAGKTRVSTINLASGCICKVRDI